MSYSKVPEVLTTLLAFPMIYWGVILRTWGEWSKSVSAIPRESYFCLMPLHQRYGFWTLHPPCQTLSHSFPQRLFFMAFTTIWDTYSSADWLSLPNRTKAQLFVKLGFVHSICPVSRTEPEIKRTLKRLKRPPLALAMNKPGFEPRKIWLWKLCSWLDLE